MKSNEKRKMIKNPLVILLLIVTITIGFIAYSTYNKTHDDLRDEIADFTMSSETLFRAFSSNESSASAKYTDKILEISGEVTKIEKAGNGSTQLYLNGGDMMFGVICDMEQHAGIAQIEPGQHVIIRGICSGFLMDVALNRCVLIK